MHVRIRALVVSSLALSVGACSYPIVEGDEQGDSAASEESGESSASTEESSASTEESSESSGEDSEDSGEPFCGDALCNGDEDCMTCALDCGACPGCGDGICDELETCETCPADCPVDECDGSPTCGDDVCEEGESCAECPADCGECDVCGNGQCGNGETCEACPEDCGECACPCSEDRGIDNFCFYPPLTANCPMTAPGGYCDPNGDGNYDDGDWNMGFVEYLEQCG